MNVEGVKAEKAFLVLSGHPTSIMKVGEPAEIIGLKVITLEDGFSDTCYHIRFIDGTEEYISIHDHNILRIVPGSHCKIRFVK